MPNVPYNQCSRFVVFDLGIWGVQADMILSRNAQTPGSSCNAIYKFIKQDGFDDQQILRNFNPETIKKFSSWIVLRVLWRRFIKTICRPFILFVSHLHRPQRTLRAQILYQTVIHITEGDELVLDYQWSSTGSRNSVLQVMETALFL